MWNQGTWTQVAAIVGAQFRIFRNHLPRTGWTSVAGNLLSLLWYAMIATAAIALAIGLPAVPVWSLVRNLPVALVMALLAWQLVPLFTLSTGWSLQLNKLQIYPVSTRALFLIEVILRVTASPEMILLCVGATIGLLRHPGLPGFAPAALLLFIPLNLLLSLAVREAFLHSFKRNRLRELLAIFLIGISIVPQVLLRAGYQERAFSILSSVARYRFSPWYAVARLSSGRAQWLDGLVILFWISAAYLLARWLFSRSLTFEEIATQSTSGESAVAAGANRRWSIAAIAEVFSDPLAALIQKELRSLVRMPRFRIQFGMACLFSVLIFFPLAMNTERAGTSFIGHNFLPIVALYGLLILSDSLLLNIFGTDRAAVALYFVAPVPFATVLRAKNISAAIFLLFQVVFVSVVTSLLRRPVTLTDVVSAVAAVSVVGLMFLSFGNVSSILMARPADPKQTFRRAAGGKMQLMVLGCSLAMSILLGAAFLARWALDAYWAFLLVLAVELGIGLIVYKVAMDSALERAVGGQERMVDSLSKSASMIGSSG